MKTFVRTGAGILCAALSLSAAEAERGGASFDLLSVTAARESNRILSNAAPAKVLRADSVEVSYSGSLAGWIAFLGLAVRRRALVG